MKFHLIKAVVFALLAICLFSTSCKDESVTPAEDEKTLNKELLYDKQWESAAGTGHYFYSDGKYSNTGTWKWLNDSDSMEVVAHTGAQALIWWFEWCTEDEMSCRLGNSGDYAVYTWQK